MNLIKPLFLFLIIARAAASDSLEELGHQMMNFYLSPTPESFAQYQKNADRFEEALAQKGNGADVLLAVGIAKISQKHDWPITGTGKAATTAKEILQGKTPLAQYIADDNAADPSKLDIWWVSFFSTGDVEYLSKILKYAGDPLPKGDMTKMMIIGAATWSFKSNCKQHKAVRDFARSQIESAPTSEKKKFLEECAGGDTK